jgi:hypothetical protein
MSETIRYFGIFTPASGASFVTGSRLAISGIAGLYDPSFPAPVFLGPHRYLVQVSDAQGNPRFRADTNLPGQFTVQATMRWFSTAMTLPGGLSGTASQTYKIDLWAWYAAPSPAAPDAHAEVAFELQPPGGSKTKWTPPGAHNPLKLAIEGPAVDEEFPAGFDINLHGLAKDFKLDFFLYVLVINKQNNFVVDNLIIPAVFPTDQGYRFRATLRPAPSGQAGEVIPHDIVVLALDKYRGEVHSATRRRIQVRIF